MLPKRNRLAAVAAIIFATLASFCAEARTIYDFRHLTDHTNIEEYPDITVQFTVQVTFASPLMPGLYAVANSDDVNYRAVFMRVNEGVKLREGDIVDITGTVALENGLKTISAEKVTVLHNFKLPEAPERKFADMRRGLLDARRSRYWGWIDESHVQTPADGSQTVFHLAIGRTYIVCRVPGRLEIKKYIGAPVVVTGIAMSHFDEKTGAPKFVSFEISSLSHIVSQRESDWRNEALVASCTAGALLAIAFFWLWLSVRRDRIASEAIAAERRRMASELHDTVEQHFAAARLLVVGALHVKDMPEKAAALLRQAAATMANAKLEVRDAVTKLRGADEEGKPLAVSLKEIAQSITKSGAARVLTRLEALPQDLGASAAADIVAITREAATNAVKHGKAKNIAIVADALKTNGGFTLRIVNDGEKFDFSGILGPETGHFGISGMRERANRSDLAFAFISHGRWCGIQLSRGHTSS